MTRSTSTSRRLSFWLRVLAPYLALAVGWFGFQNAWLTIILYHAQIVFWLLYDRGMSNATSQTQNSSYHLWWAALPAAAAGPALYFLLPHITHTDLLSWLAEYQLDGRRLLFMIPYFGLVHPVLEQRHWSRLRQQSSAAHGAFAAYHALVLYSLLAWPWVLLTLAVLVGASIAWAFLTKRWGLAVPILSHSAADLGVVAAAWLLARSG